MTAQSGPRVPTRKEGNKSSPPMKGATKIWNGAIVVMESGLAIPGKVGTGLTTLGIATATVDNIGGDGAAAVTVERGTFKFFNYGSDAVTAAEIGKNCYVFDDQTVAKTDGSSARSVAGKVIDVDSDGVWVALG
ncbi:MAG: hypothetical protein R3D70_10680 [Rhizobiaceae bacterium]